MSKPRQDAVPPHLDAAAWDSISPIQVEDDSTIISVTIPAPLIDCQTFLRASAGAERLFWAVPETNGGETQFAGAGIAAELRVLPDIDGVSAERDPYAMIQQSAVKLLAGSRQFVAETGDELPRLIDNMSAIESASTGRPRLFGGFSFQTEFVPDNTWSVYHPAHFILPHFLLTKTEDGTWLTIHAADQSGQQATDVALELLAAVRTRYTLLQDAAVERRNGTAVTHRDTQPSIRYPMGRADWFTLVDNATTKIAEGALQKVVLARVAEVRMESPIDPLEAIDYLLTTYPTCYRFMFEPVPGHAFFGASPELLVEKKDRKVTTMALAGSVGRGQTTEEDRALATALLNSPKDGREHALVVDSIRARLEPLAEQLSPPEEPGLLRFHNIQHLHTPIRVTLPEQSTTTVLDLVRELHPTPALGGVPREQALAFLVKAEPVPRGWYAAPVGWFDATLDGAFTVAIRSAVCQHNRAWLYAGAGIVAASDPEMEWRETNLKFRPMLEALRLSIEVDHA